MILSNQNPAEASRINKTASNMETPTIVFPKLGKMYPNHTIISIEYAFLPLLGWQEQQYCSNIIAQYWRLKRLCFSRISFQLQNNATKELFLSDWSFEELSFFSTSKQVEAPVKQSVYELSLV